MKNKEKILIALASFSFFLIVYLVIVSKEIEMPSEKVVKEETVIEKVDLVALKSNYQEAVRVVYAQLNNEVKFTGSSTEEIDIDEKLLEIKNKMMSLSVPGEYRIFHLSFIMMIDKVLSDELVIDREFQDGLDKIGQENLWLN